MNHSGQNDLVCHPWLVNEITFPILACATIGAAKAAFDGINYVKQKGSISANDFKNTLKKMGEEALYWGTIAGVFAVTKYGLEFVLCNHDLMEFFIAILVTMALIYGRENKNNGFTEMDMVVRGIIVGIAACAYKHVTGK